VDERAVAQVLERLCTQASRRNDVIEVEGRAAHKGEHSHQGPFAAAQDDRQNHQKCQATVDQHGAHRGEVRVLR